MIISASNEEGGRSSWLLWFSGAIPNADFLSVNDVFEDGTVRVCRKNRYRFIDLQVSLILAGAFQSCCCRCCA